MRQIVAFAGVFFVAASYSAVKSIIFLLLKESCENIMLGLSDVIFRRGKPAWQPMHCFFRFV